MKTQRKAPWSLMMLALIAPVAAMAQSVEVGGIDRFKAIRVIGNLTVGGAAAVTGQVSCASLAASAGATYGGTVDATAFTTTGGGGACAYTLENGAYICGGSSSNPITWSGSAWDFNKTVTSSVGSGTIAYQMPNGGRFAIDAAGTRYVSGGGTTFDFNGGAINCSSGITGGSSTLPVQSGVADSASAVGIRINAATTLSTAGSVVAQFENASVIQSIVTPTGDWVQLGGAPEKLGSYFPTQTTDTAFTAVGLPAPTLLAGTPTASNADTLYQLINFATGATNGNASGFSGPFTTTRATHLPRAMFIVRTDPSDITNTRLIFGFAASALESVGTLAGANGIRGCWLRYDTGLSDTAWQAISSDGTTASATTTSVTVAAATTYIVLIDMGQAASTCKFYVNGVLKVSKATNIPSGSTALGLEGSVTTLANAAKNVLIARVALRQR